MSKLVDAPTSQVEAAPKATLALSNVTTDSEDD
jgi:hypothetical protein